tara:strand:+ start:394 stop:798 length:405 start_codon:yes stop_codon:yes gene_type:complete
MADLSITSSTIVAGAGARLLTVTAGATITQGGVVYLDSSGKYSLADAGAATTDDVLGIALCAASDGQPLVVQVAGNVTIPDIDAADVGTVYYLSNTAGAIQDGLSSSEYVTIIGVAAADNTLKLILNTTNAQKP